MNEQANIEQRFEAIKAEILALKQAKRAGLLMRSYDWSDEDLDPGTYQIVFEGEPQVFPCISLFSGTAIVTPFIPVVEDGVYSQRFLILGNASANLHIISTSPIASVTRLNS